MSVRRTERTQAPAWGAFMLSVTPVVSAVAAAVGLAIGVLVVPLLDPTPWIAWILVRRIRRWEGTSQRLLRATSALARIMMAHWLLAYAWLCFGSAVRDGARLQWFIETAGATWSVYLLELAALLVLITTACVASLIGLYRRGKNELLAQGIGPVSQGDG